MRFRFALLIFFCLAAGCGLQSAKEPAEATRYWRGSFEISGLQWEVGLHFSGDCAAGALIDVDAVWRANVPAEDFACDADKISFSLPMALGRFDGKRADGEIVGAVLRDDGAAAGLTLLPASVAEVRRVDFSLNRDGVNIGATLVLPEGEGPFPAIVVVHGGGDSDRYAPPYHFWGDYLARRGFAVVLYDKRGNGDSGGSWRDVGFGPRAEDLAAIVDKLAGRKDIVGGSIGALAVSQGGWVTALASTLTRNLSFYAAISSPMVSPGVADTFATASSMRARGLPEEEISQVIAVWEEEMALMRQLDSSAAWAKYDALIARVRNEGWYVRADYSPLTRGAWFGRWYAKVMDFDPTSIVRGSRTPSLWLYGSADTQSDPERNMAVIRGFERPTTEVKAIMFSGGDHGVMVTHDAEGKYPSAAPGFFAALNEWIEDRAVSKSR